MSCWYLYIIRTRSGRLYTGITTDISRRFHQHQQGKGAKFFRIDPPDEIVYQWRFPDRSQASAAEWRVKRLSKDKKLALIADKLPVC